MISDGGLVCPVCGWAGEQFGPGPGRRPNAACPRCGSLERHRFLVAVAAAVAPQVVRDRALLDVAPMTATTPWFRRLSGDRYLSVDFDPAADRRTVVASASLTQLPLQEACIDLLVCYHVLEHIPDDRAAMREIQRVLAPGGLALVQVPRRAGATDEDPDAPEAERITRFGQADHVRFYGDDFESRLEECGLAVTTVSPRQLLPGDLVERFRLIPDEVVWLVRRAGDPEETKVAWDADRMLPVMVSLAAHACTEVTARTAKAPDAATAARLKAVEARLAKAEADARRWQRSYRELRGRLPVRAVAGAARLARRALGAARSRS